MKLYQWTCPHCQRTFRSEDKQALLREKDGHLSYCGKPKIYTAPPVKHVDQIDTIEIIH